MNNKKGDLILGSSVRLIISVLVLVMLIGLLIAVYYIFVAENELQKIKKQMDKLEEITKKVHQSGKLSTIDFFPIVDWYLRSFSLAEFPKGACADNRAESCLCVCNTQECGDKFDCRWFDFDLVVDEKIRETVVVSSTYAASGYVFYIPGIFLKDSIYQFKISKEGEFVIIQNDL